MSPGLEEDTLESWDLDPDFSFPPSRTSLLPPPSTSSIPPSPSPPPEEEEDFFSLLDSKLPPLEEGKRKREKGDSLNSIASSTDSNGTLKGGDATVRIGDASIDVREEVQEEEREVGREPKKMQTIRLGSDLSKLLSCTRMGGGGGGNTKGRGGIGTASGSGNTKEGASSEVGHADWDQDLEIEFGEEAFGKDGGRGESTVLGKKIREGRRLGSDETNSGKDPNYTSHLLIDDEDNDSNSMPPSSNAFKLTASQTKEPPSKLRPRVSIDSFRDDISEVSDLDFELPSTQSTFSISPSLSLPLSPSSSPDPPIDIDEQHPSRESSTSSTRTQVVTLSPLSNSPAPPSRLSNLSLHSRSNSLLSATTTTDDEAGRGGGRGGGGSDADFFQDLELPSYFLGSNHSTSTKQGGGGGTTTPPTSDGEFSFSGQISPRSPTRTNREDEKRGIDLQGLLKEKLEMRGGRGLLFRTSSTGSIGGGVSSPTQEQLEGLEKHREKENEELETGKDLSLVQERDVKKKQGEEGLVEEEEEENWNAEEMRRRMRTISGVRAREAALARNTRGGTVGTRRTASMGSGGTRVPTMSSLTSAAGGGPRRPIGHARRSDTASSEGTYPARAGTRSSLSRSGSTTSVASQPTHLPSSRSSLPHVVRPSSAQSTHSSHISTSVHVRRGPPPAPSTASRDRVRMRTISLRTVGSHSDLSSQNLNPLPSRRNTRSNSIQSLEEGNERPSSTATGGSHPARAASSPGPTGTQTLRPKRSHQLLRPSNATSGPTSGGRSLEKKRSLQNLSTMASSAHQTPSRPTSRQTSLLSPSPAAATTTLERRPSFAAPTASSSSRLRERVHSNPHPLTHVPSSPAPSRSHPSDTPNHSRLLQPTLSSASKSRLPSSSVRPSSSLRIPSQPFHLSRPLTLNRTTSTSSSTARTEKHERDEGEEYGDGTELDGFDDLPVSKEREKSIVQKNRGTSCRSSTPGGGARTTVGHGRASLGKEGEKGKARSSLPVLASAGLRRVGERTREQAKDASGKRKKREPHLIRHLGGTGGGHPKVQGDMTYNPTLQRWEGNESILREFDKALSTSTRPALISPFSSSLASPNRTGFSSPPPLVIERSSTATSPPVVAQRVPSGSSRGGVKVVGDMVFDPSTCSWHAIAGPEGEDELELDWGGDIADDEHQEGHEGGGDGWEKGEEERMLKNRASFVLSEGEEGSSQEEDEAGVGGGKRKMTKRGIWRESKKAEERSREEMRSWVTHEEVDRSWLYELRALILDSR